LKKILRGAHLLTKPIAVAPIPYGYVASEKKQDGVFYVGDQFAVIPSFTSREAYPWVKPWRPALLAA